jgi:hypothetical protein
MGTRRWLGIVFTPSWLRVAEVDVSRNKDLICQVYGVPLPVGCINEDSGLIEDSRTLQEAIESVPCIAPESCGDGRVFLVVPQLLCYRTACVVPSVLQNATIEQLLTHCSADLPGDRNSLIVDAYAHHPTPREERSVMIVAARRNAIEAYVRLFAGWVWCIGGITTGEVSRLNRWRLQRSDIASEIVLVCSSDVDFFELSVWDRGVLMASETQYRRQRTRRVSQPYGSSNANFDGAQEVVARDILSVLARQRDLGRPIARVLYGGALCERYELHAAVQNASGTPYDVSTGRGCLNVTGQKSRLDEGDAAPGSGRGLFDDAVGAVIPRLLSTRGRCRRKVNGLYQPYA